MKSILLSLLFSTTLFAQIGIGTSNPSSSAILEVTTSTRDKGILIPRVAIEDLNTQAPITGNMEESLLVYNTDMASGKGFYYWNGMIWQPLTSNNTSNGVDPSSFWKTTGNSSTTAGTNTGEDFLGTLDDQDLVIATNTQERMRVKTNGNIGIGENNATQLLHISTAVNGQGIKIQRGSDNFEITQSNTNLNSNASNNNGTFSYSFSGANKLIMDNNQFYPAVNSTDNTNSTGYDLGIFSRHFRRVYTQGVHTNDNDPDGGLRINIGSGGGTTADYMFSDFAHFPFLNGVKDLGRNGNSWNNFYFQNAFRTSDRRKKQNIEPLQPGLEVINSLNTYQYHYINDKENQLQYGFMAQELQGQIPSIVDEGKDDQKSLAVDYGQVIPILVKAVQEQQVQIELLKEEIKALKK
ncbi:tail fiber domain-containing protein [Nonlabens sp. Ci31]|jgi:hypothetical protein|uniref:tail fiber domain-containing protein n=1 Tax=Nonlabens sp. Ci31 TaxID=2608253 RepID=UPI0014646972|nr:tail fiber domain-containing protein [Nonlabens sp. Ci31]QJP34228.1 tail fiber domain-containing protein [Nonlabens sp. Ci31]